MVGERRGLARESMIITARYYSLHARRLHRKGVEHPLLSFVRRTICSSTTMSEINKSKVSYATGRLWLCIERRTNVKICVLSRLGSVVSELCWEIT
jgi:hypothetical protein